MAGLLCPLAAASQQTPPIEPKISVTPLPPPVDVPPPPNTPADVPNRPLTADEAARIALRYQPSIAVARANYAGAQGLTQQARSFLGPSVSVPITYTHVEAISHSNSAVSATTTASEQGLVASPTLRQLIFDFNHTRDQVRQQQFQERSLGYAVTQSQYDTTLTVKQAFYTYVQNTRLVDVNTANLHSTQAQLDLAEARLHAGLGLPSDVVQAQTAVSEAVLNLNLAQNAVTTSRIALAQDMGIDPRTPIQAADTPEPAPSITDVPGLVATALRQRPEMLEAQATLRSNQYGVSVARTTNSPSLSANAGLLSHDDQVLPEDNFFIVGASLTWTPFDSGYTAGRVKQARALVAAAEAQLANTRLSVTSDVSQSYVNVRQAEQRVVTAQSEVANAQESVRLQEGRYRAGLGTFLDVITAQAALVTAQTDLVNAQTAVNQFRSALVHSIGSPLPAR
jgi:outer membrane protein